MIASSSIERIVDWASLGPVKRSAAVSRFLLCRRTNSLLDQVGTFVSMVGLSVPSFFSGVLAILIFAVYLSWLPWVYNTNLVVNSLSSFGEQVRQIVMPVTVLTVQTTSKMSRYLRSSKLDGLGRDYVRAARAKGVSETLVIACPLIAQFDDPGSDRHLAWVASRPRRRVRCRTNIQGKGNRPSPDHRYLRP